MENNFSEKTVKLWKKIGTHGIMTLATCAENRVTSRQMSVIVYNGKFYFQTDETFLKYKQIEINPNAALCFKNYSIEGKCRIIGSPIGESNSFFIELYKKYFLMSYKSYSSIPTERLIEITPSLIYSWEYKLTKPFMEYFDFENQTYRLENMSDKK
jgi:uncharacterized pyridoxamine 5'-phosphate oxidase family protein